MLTTPSTPRWNFLVTGPDLIRHYCQHKQVALRLLRERLAPQCLQRFELKSNFEPRRLKERMKYVPVIIEFAC